MKLIHIFAFLALILAYSRGALTESLTMVSYPPTSKVLQIGETITANFKLKYQGVKPGTSVYVIPSALIDDSVLLEEDSSINATNPTLSFCGSFVSKDSGHFSISAADRPISTSFNYDELLKTLEGKFPKEQIDKFRQSTKSEKLHLSFGFITTLESTDGLAEGSITIKTPNLPYYYNGVLLTPYFFSFNEKGSLCAKYDGKTMHSIKYAVTPNRTRKEKKQKEQSFVPKGSVSIISQSPATPQLVIGKQNRISLTVRYSDLPPNTDIYVFLNTMNNDRLLLNDRTFSAAGVSFTSCKSDKLDSGRFAIPAGNRPLGLDMPFVGRMEAAYLTSIKNGGRGTATGTIVFTPPFLTSYYNVVQLTPSLYQWSDEGKRCTRFSAKHSNSINLPILGR